MGAPTYDARSSDCQLVFVGASGSSATLRPGGLRWLQPPPSGRRNKVPRGGGDRGSAALRDDYGGQRERSGIARAAVPRRAGPEGSSLVLRSPSGSHVVFCVRPLWWTASCPRRGRRRWSTSPAQAQRGLTGGPAPVVRPLCCVGHSVLQSPAHAGARVLALLPRG